MGGVRVQAQKILSNVPDTTFLMRMATPSNTVVMNFLLQNYTLTPVQLLYQDLAQQFLNRQQRRPHPGIYIVKPFSPTLIGTGLSDFLTSLTPSHGTDWSRSAEKISNFFTSTFLGVRLWHGIIRSTRMRTRM